MEDHELPVKWDLQFLQHKNLDCGFLDYDTMQS